MKTQTDAKEGADMHMKKRETSKVILFVAFAVAVIVILFTFVMVWRTCDLTPLEYIIGGASAVLTTCVGFYYWKARLENSIKLKRQYGQSVSVDEEINSATNYTFEDTSNV